MTNEWMIILRTIIQNWHMEKIITFPTSKKGTGVWNNRGGREIAQDPLFT